MDKNIESYGMVSSEKLEILITLPYMTGTEFQKARAKARANDIAKRLLNSQYGIMHVNDSERVTRLSREDFINLSMCKIGYQSV